MNYFDNSGRDDILSGGVKMIPIDTPKGRFHVWTKRTGNNPRIKVLLLHGGPGVTHEYGAADVGERLFECGGDTSSEVWSPVRVVSLERQSAESAEVEWRFRIDLDADY